ncbi:MAG: hypothetical protein JRG85_10240 [Deltaproteobacteria bacterium]|nr:hypothetical protein [Deltaproteobacteria bacterium]
MNAPRRPRLIHAPISVLALLAVSALSLGFSSCDSWGSPFFHFRSPLPRQLSLIGEIGFELTLPRHADAESLVVRLVDPEGASMPVPGVAVGDRTGTGSVAIGEAGNYRLEAEVDARIFFFFARHLTAGTRFEIADLEHPDECEILNDVECLLPYPSSRFLVEDTSTQTGYRVDVPQLGIPKPTGPEIPKAMLNSLDGFSPTVQILMHFPGGVDVEQSGASRLLAPECCGQPAGPAWIDTRTHDDRSLDHDSPTVLLDWDTGQRILHWLEVDARAEGSPERQALILRPAESLTPGHRYIVAVRNLVREDGTPVEAEPAFAALRDFRPTDIPALAERRLPMLEIFHELRRAGVRRSELILAFDFVVQSEHQLTHQMLTMRDKAFEWLEEQKGLGVQTFSAVGIEDFPNCAMDGGVHRRIVEGTFQSPLFLEAVPVLI